MRWARYITWQKPSGTRSTVKVILWANQDCPPPPPNLLNSRAKRLLQLYIHTPTHHTF